MDQFIIPAPQAAFGFAAVIFLALHVFRVNSAVLNKTVMIFAAIASAYAAVFTYLYSADNEVFLGGFIARRAGLMFFISACFMVLLSMRGRKFGDYFFIGVSSVMFISALSIGSNSMPALAAGFFSVDIFSMLLRKKEAETGEGVHEEASGNKALYFILACAFMIFFMFAPDGTKQAKIAFNGMIFMLILSTLSGFFSVTSNELPALKQPVMPSWALLNFIPVLAQFVILSAIIARTPGLLTGPFMSAALASLLLLAAFKSVTEEKYSLFIQRDMYILFFLGVLGLSCADISASQAAVYTALFVISAVFAAEALGGANSAKQTMTGVKYSFEKIHGGLNILASTAAGLLAEVFMMWVIYSNISPNPLIQAVVLIGAALYSPAFLNKLFTLFSMIKRIKVDLKAKTVFNVNVLIMTLFLSMVLVMLYKW